MVVFLNSRTTSLFFLADQVYRLFHNGHVISGIPFYVVDPSLKLLYNQCLQNPMLRSAEQS